MQVTVPCAVRVTSRPSKVSGSPSGSESLAMTLTVAVPSTVVAMSSAATGGSSTVIVTVAVLESTVPSLALNVKLSVPWYPLSGVYVYDPSAATLTEPWAGSLTLEYVKVSPSTSAAVTDPSAGVSTPVTTASSSATGASLAGVTVIVTVATFESRLPSLA